MFILQNTPQQAVALPGVQLDSMPIAGGASDFDLLLSMHEAGGALHGVLIYPPELFDAATIERLLAQLQCLLAAALDAPEAGPSRIRCR